MPTFDISSVRARKSGGGNSPGILLDQLQIAENALATDGFLSEGDYNSLIAMAQKLSLSPGLSSDQRSNYNVKISEYRKNKVVSQVNNLGDIERMNNSIKDEAATDVILAGNKPALFLQGRLDSLKAKLNDLQQTMDLREGRGQDASQYAMEFTETLKQLQNYSDAYDAMAGAGEGGVANGYAAYVDTNPQGEIIGVDYGPIGSKNGYRETSGVLGGFQVYGKPYSQSGRNIFKLGKETFSSVDRYINDPNNPGAMMLEPTRLVATSQQQGSAANKQGSSQLLMLDPNTISSQSYIPRGGMAKGQSGTIYKRKDDGSYQKILNFTGPIDERAILNIPRSVEQKLNMVSNETVDYAASQTPAGAEQGQVNQLNPIVPSVSEGSLPVQNAPSNPAEPFNNTPPAFNLQGNQTGTAVPAVPSVKQSSQPISRSPQSAGGYAAQTLKKGVDFVKNIFS